MDIDRNSISVIIPEIEKETPTIIKELVQQNHSIVEVKHEFPTLERIYLELVETERVPRENHEEEDQ